MYFGQDILWNVCLYCPKPPPKHWKALYVIVNTQKIVTFNRQLTILLQIGVCYVRCVQYCDVNLPIFIQNSIWNHLVKSPSQITVECCLRRQLPKTKLIPIQYLNRYRKDECLLKNKDSKKYFLQRCHKITIWFPFQWTVLKSTFFLPF